jgi:hypothetical protein
VAKEWKPPQPESGGEAIEMSDFVVGFVCDLLIFSIGYPVARLALPCLSFGRLYAQPLSSPDHGFNLLGYRHDGNGRIEIDSGIAGAFGFVIFLIAMISFGSLFSTLF